MYVLDTSTWECCNLHGWTTKPLARIGLADNREITGDFSLVSENEEANGIIADISTDLAAVA